MAAFGKIASLDGWRPCLLRIGVLLNSRGIVLLTMHWMVALSSIEDWVRKAGVVGRAGGDPTDHQRLRRILAVGPLTTFLVQFDTRTVFF